jgi:hypothetical protein
MQRPRHGHEAKSASHDAERERAGRELLAMPPPPGDGSEPDWEDQKREMLDARMRKYSECQR